MFSKLVSQGSAFLMEGVKNLVVKQHVSFFLLKLFQDLKWTLLILEFTNNTYRGPIDGK